MIDDFDTSSLATFLSQYAPIPSGSYNLEPDFGVNEFGQIVGMGGGNLSGETGSFSDGRWIPAGAVSGVDAASLGKLFGGLGSALKPIGSALTSRGGVAGIAALLSMLDRQKPRGGGTTAAYAGAKPMTRTVTQGRYGPIARYAASGGLMQAYAQGGSVQPFPMQDGGFVMTKRAVDGAGGPQGMRQQLPEAVPIRGPGHGTSDSIPAYIQGENGRTPAKVSNGEMYVPPGRNTQGLYALMRALERKA